jgi:hypothetical protein
MDEFKKIPGIEPRCDSKYYYWMKCDKEISRRENSAGGWESSIGHPAGRVVQFRP